jgi:hypothetical protein
MVKQTHPVMGLLVVGMILACSVWAYKHFISAPPQSTVRTPKQRRSSNPTKRQVGPVPETGELSVIEKFMEGSKAVLKGKETQIPAMTYRVNTETQEQKEVVESTEERVEKYYKGF